MESPRARACPNCSAPAAAPQRWCLECGHELPGPRRPGLRPAVGVVTTLAVLVGAASAGGYTLLQDDRQPPPPATTVAQTAPATTPTLPPATQEPTPYTPAYTAPSTPRSSSGGSKYGGATTTHHGSTGGSSPGTSGSSGNTSDGSVKPDTTTTTQTTPPKPQFAITDVALGAAAVAYAPYSPPNVDLGDPSRAVDGSVRTAWKAPAASDPSAPPQVGMYVDLAGKEKLRKLVLKTPTPGMSVEIYAATRGPPAAITDPGWDHLASRSGVAAETKVKLPDRAYRYVLVWIVGAPPDGSRPAISELSLLSLQPE
ncbi:MAG: hypothetical protein JSS99_14895 [Actinobacteria bacterium]|nr:hypothetical protein [Actinomycetota bacterium]